MSKASGFLASCTLDTSHITPEDWELVEVLGGYAIKLTLNGASITSECVECLGWASKELHYTYTLLQVGVMYNLPLNTAELEALISMVGNLQTRNTQLAREVVNLETAITKLEHK